MGCAVSSLEKEAAERSRKIDRQLQIDGEQASREVREGHMIEFYVFPMFGQIAQPMIFSQNLLQLGIEILAFYQIVSHSF